MGSLNSGGVDISATTPTTQAHGDAAVVGVDGNASDALHKHAMPAAGGGALAHEGSNTTEATTTSGTSVDLLSITSLTIGALQPLMAIAVWRKSSGAADDVRMGIKLNTTNVLSPQNFGSTSDAADEGMQMIVVPARLTAYEKCGLQTLTAGVGASGNNQLVGLVAADAPLVEITVIVFSGQSDNASITLGMDEGHAYSYATS